MYRSLARNDNVNLVTKNTKKLCDLYFHLNLLSFFPDSMRLFCFRFPQVFISIFSIGIFQIFSFHSNSRRFSNLNRNFWFRWNCWSFRFGRYENETSWYFRSCFSYSILIVDLVKWFVLGQHWIIRSVCVWFCWWSAPIQFTIIEISIPQHRFQFQ